ncbi:MAG: GAF domain-containing protein [Vicinamibacterales bacterium]
MPLDDELRHSIDAAVEALRARLDDGLTTAAADLRAALDAVDARRAEERAQATEAARAAAFAEAQAETERLVAEAEARGRATLDEAVAAARADERETASPEIRRIVEAEMRQKVEHELAAAEQRMAAALADAEARAASTTRESVKAAKVEERESEMAGVSRLVESIRGLDGATSLSEVLDALAQAASREAARVAVVLLRGDRVTGWRLSGFGPRDQQPKSVDLALNQAGVIGLAVGAARPVTTRDSQTAAKGPVFEHLPTDRMGMAVPVIVGGRVVAVLYGDSVTHDPAAHTAPSAWPEVLEILARHAARCLEALTAQKTLSTPTSRFWGGPGRTGGTDAPAHDGRPPSPPLQMQATSGPAVPVPPSAETSTQPSNVAEESARRFARLLLSEIRLYHEPAVAEGRERRNLLARLAPELERARRMYDARVPVSLRTRAELFQQEIVATLAGGDQSLLGAPA